jgi:hypothetical protein
VSTKVSVSRIIAEHLATLRPQGTSAGYSKLDMVTFYGVPTIAAAIYYAMMPTLTNDAVTQIDSVLVAAFSIFAALLLNMQVLIIGLRDRREGDTQSGSQDRSPEDQHLIDQLSAARHKHIAELFANVSYCIVVSIVLVGGTVISIFLQLQSRPLLKAIQFFVILHFALTGIMVLKRMHVLFSHRK